MGKTTEYLGLYEPYDSDFYDVDRDQNENFTILDNKAKEVDETIKGLGSNKQDKTDNNLQTDAKNVVEGINEVAKYTDGLATSKTVNSFPLSQATEGEVYRVPQINKYVVCTKNYNGSEISLPNANFDRVTISNNTKKIENIFENTKILFETTTEKKQFTVPEYNDYKLLIVEFRAGIAKNGQDDVRIVLFNIGQNHITVWSSDNRSVYAVENGNFKKVIDKVNYIWIKRIIGVVRKGG